jgi:hypothetical protein
MRFNRVLDHFKSATAMYTKVHEGAKWWVIAIDAVVILVITVALIGWLK